MKRLLLWVLMVALFVVILLGGVAAAFYAFAGEGDLPEETASFGGVTLQNVGYEWEVPILGGVLNKHFYEPSTLTVQKLGAFEETRPELVVPDWVTQSELTLTAPDGTVAFSGSAGDYAGFTYTQNGTYTMRLSLYQTSEAKPAKPIGSYLYQASFSVLFQPKVALSSTSASQGSVVAIQLTGILEDAQPTAETDLGPVWFRPIEGGWMGYVPVTHNAEAGVHTITMTCGSQNFSAELSVRQRIVDSAPYVDDGPTTEAAGQQYRNAIWPLFETGSSEKLWSGLFQHPAPVVITEYGCPLVTEDGTRAGTSTGITYFTEPGEEVCAPQSGQVVYAGTLELSGGTVVIDHGCGVKSYLFGLGEVAVERGSAVAAGDKIGAAGSEHQLIYELRIGNKTVNPYEAIRGTSGLQYRENA